MITEKFDGAIEFITLGGASAFSQVSDNAIISMLLSKINSWSKLGLSNVIVEVAADLTLKFEKLRLAGPGLSSMSPESKRSMRRKTTEKQQEPEWSVGLEKFCYGPDVETHFASGLWVQDTKNLVR